MPDQPYVDFVGHRWRSRRWHNIFWGMVGAKVVALAAIWAWIASRG